MYRSRLNTIISLLLISTFLTYVPFLSTSALAQSEEEMYVLLLFYNEKDIVVTATRTAKPITQVAENISVITSDEIEEMNYHTLPEVLNHVPGMQVFMGNPWYGTANIQGNKDEHSVVMIDGVKLNYLSSKYVDLGSISVQNIHRIEIIKGPASSAWGSSIGGIINIITKPAGSTEKPEGMASVSYGEHGTIDSRAEISGRFDKIGYYLSAGNMTSDGFKPNAWVDENNIYTKLRWDATDFLKMILTLGYDRGSRGQGAFTEPLAFSGDDAFENIFSTLSLNYSIDNETALNLSLRTSKKDYEQTATLLTGGELRKLSENNESNGVSADFKWKRGIHNIVIGADYEKGDPGFNDKIDFGVIDPAYCIFMPAYCSTAIIDKKLENWAVYANDTVTFDSLTITPGVRFDSTNVGGDFLSPSLGITYQLTEKSLLRAYAAQGFSTPSLEDSSGIGFFVTTNPDLDVEKVRSYQAGFETSALDYLWLKASLFRHDIRDAIISNSQGEMVNNDKQRRLGYEIEIRTLPFYNTALFAGFTYVDADNLSDGDIIEGYAKNTTDIGLKYNDKRTLSATLKGHYIKWVQIPGFHSETNAFIWDLNISKKFKVNNSLTADTFITAHNLFNGSQYQIDAYQNPRRWAEAGVRLQF